MGVSATQFAWLIEGDACYWNGRAADSTAFTSNVNDAIRFCRKEDAEVIRWRLLGFAAFALRVTHHGFVERPSGV